MLQIKILCPNIVCLIGSIIGRYIKKESKPVEKIFYFVNMDIILKGITC